MRRSALRIASPIALALAVVTCGDAATSAQHHSGPGRIAIQPQFAPQAAAVLRSLGAFSFSITNVRLVLQRPPSFVLKDTAVFFTAGSDSVSIDMVVVLIASVETLSARVQLRDGNTVLFEGVQSLIARQGSGAGSAPVNVAVSYVGPGANATHVAVQTPKPTVLTAGTAQFTATATDAANQSVAGLPISWTSSNTAVASVTASGLATGLRLGTATITATGPNGVSGSAVLQVTVAPARLSVVSGDGQTGTVGAALSQPVVIAALASDGTPVPGVAVAFRVTGGGGSVGSATVTTDASGHAATTLTLGTITGPNTFEASVVGITAVSVTEAANSAAATSIALVSGDGQSGVVGSALALQLAVRATDRFGNAVQNATVGWTRVAGAGAVAASSSATRSDGLAAVTYTLGSAARTDTVRADLSGGSGPNASVVFTMRGTSGAASVIAIVSGSGQSAIAGNTLANPLVVRVTDGAGNAAAGVTVAWRIATGGGFLSAPSSITDATGRAAITFRLALAVGTATIGAAINATPEVLFSEQGIVGLASSLARMAGDGQSGLVGSVLSAAPSVRVADANGNPVSGSAVTFSVTSGGGTVTAGSQVTNASGIATVGSWRLGSSLGPQSLTAAAGPLTAVFTANAVGAATAATFSADSGGGQVGAPLATLPFQLVVSARDSVGAAVPGLTVTWTLLPAIALATGTTDAGGRARLIYTLGSIPSTDDVRATLQGGLFVDFIETSGISGAAWQLSPATVPTVTTTAVPFATQPSIRVTDAFGSPVADSGVVVTATVSSGYTLIGVTSATTNASGVAIFTNLGVTRLAGPGQANITFSTVISLKSTTIGVTVN